MQASDNISHHSDVFSFMGLVSWSNLTDLFCHPYVKSRSSTWLPPSLVDDAAAVAECVEEDGAVLERHLLDEVEQLPGERPHPLLLHEDVLVGRRVADGDAPGVLVDLAVLGQLFVP